MRDIKFPQCVKRGSCAVMIYSTPSKGRPLFTLSYYDANRRRCRPSFASYAEAKKRADEIVEKLAAGQMDVMTLCGQERLAYERAIQALRSSNISVDDAVMQFAEATSMLNGASLLDAAKLFARQNPQSIKTKRVCEVVEELIRTKRDKGRSELYQKDLRLRLGRFADAFECSISNVSPDDIDTFLGALKGAARTRNNFRLAIGTMFKFAQSKGYVGKEHQGIQSVEKETEIVKEVEVFTPHEIEVLLRGAPDELIPALAIGAFGGVRSEELKRLGWRDVDLAESHIEIRGAKSKTKTRRLIPISPNLRQWLLHFAKKDGPVTPFINLGNQFLKLSQKTGVKWKKNALRHSYISYRVALTGDISRTSLEAGNSPAIIAECYLKCVTKTQAEKWFNVVPNGPEAAVIPLIPPSEAAALEHSDTASSVPQALHPSETG